MTKRGLGILLAGAGIFLASEALALDIKGYANTLEGPASGYTAELSDSQRTIKTLTDSTGLYSCPADSFGIGETLNVQVKDKDSLETRTGKTIYTVKGSGNYVPPIYAAALGDSNLTLSARWVDDTSKVDPGAPLWGILWWNSAKRCSALVDTAALSPRYDWFASTNAPIGNADSAFVEFIKRDNNLIYQTLIGFKRDGSFYNAMQILSGGNTGNQHIKFPQTIIADSTGSEEKTIKESAAALSPNPCLGTLKVKCSEIELYSVYGGKIGTRTVKNDRVDLSDLRSGIYFVRFDNTGKKEKLIKLGN